METALSHREEFSQEFPFSLLALNTSGKRHNHFIYYSKYFLANTALSQHPGTFITTASSKTLRCTFVSLFVELHFSSCQSHGEKPSGLFLGGVLFFSALTGAGRGDHRLRPRRAIYCRG